MLLDRFLDQAGKLGALPAVTSSRGSLTYEALLSAAESVALALSTGGIGAGDRVALLLDKSPEAIATVIGILLTRAAYVPIDPRSPSFRVAQILEDSEPRALITTAHHYTRLCGEVPTIAARIPLTRLVDQAHRDAERLVIAPSSSRYHPTGPADEAPACILYTSGSTGRPKGVELSHGALRAFVDWSCRYFALGGQDRLTSFAPLTFDLSIFDIFSALSVGASTRLISPEALLNPRALVAELKQHGTTTLYAVPSTVMLLVNEGGATRATLPALRRLLYAGERFPVRSLVTAMNALGETRFFNLFGPTETNVCTCYAFDGPPAPSETDVPIGHACDHLQLELCDEAGFAVAPGQPGEICVSGPAVMTGYFRNPEANRRVFFERPPEDPRSPPARFYRTGDYARRAADGTYWFLGRRDRMVKRRGYRIELGEIEAALLHHPEIREAVATASVDEQTPTIVAYVVLAEHSTMSPLRIRAHCGSLLLPYQVPDVVKILPEIPRTLTGKLDLFALAQKWR